MSTKKDGLWSKYGFPSPKEIEDPIQEVVTLSELRKEGNPAIIALIEDVTTRITELSEQGIVGTRIVDGRIQIETNPEMMPYIVRGSYGQPGEYLTASRESTISKSLHEIRNLIIASIWDLTDRPEADDQERKHTSWLWERLQNVKVTSDLSGFDVFVEHILSFLIYGFSTFEIIWYKDPETGWVYPGEIKFREPSTVWRWVLDERGDELQGLVYATQSPVPVQYALSTGINQSLTDQQLLIFSYARLGNNYEGSSPIRPCMHWIRFKLLLGRIAAATFDTNGIPLKVIKNALETVTTGHGATDEQLDEVLEAVNDVEAGEASTIKLPNGVEIEVLSSSGQIPDILPLIEYCDLMIAMAFSSEGSFLGQNGVGSFALAEVTDMKFLSTIPGYERTIANPLNELIRRVTIHNIGERHGYAKIQMRFDSKRDNESFFKMISQLMKDGIHLWPTELQAILLEEAGLPTDLFTRWNPSMFEAFIKGSQQEPQPAFKEVNFQEEIDPVNGNFDFQKAESLMDRVEARLGKKLRVQANKSHKALVDALREEDSE